MSGSSNNKKSINNSINNYNAEFLQCFWDLANENQSIRVLAGKTLLEYLYKKNNETGSDVSSIKASVEYALNRLVRGLASSRFRFYILLYFIFHLLLKRGCSSRICSLFVRNVSS
jgi:hypothetical protein